MIDMEKTGEKVSVKKGFKYLFKKYSYYIILGGLILVLVAAITLTSILLNANPTENVNTGVIEFASPVLNGTVLKNFKSDELQYNETLKQWEIHLGLDFEAPDGTNVLTCYDGTVAKVYTNQLVGTVVEIKHSDTLTTVYKGLDTDVFVEVGDSVKKGDVIGTSSGTNTRETADGGQIHFEVWKEGALVDPAGYLNLDPK